MRRRFICRSHILGSKERKGKEARSAYIISSPESFLCPFRSYCALWRNDIISCEKRDTADIYMRTQIYALGS